MTDPTVAQRLRQVSANTEDEYLHEVCGKGADEIYRLEGLLVAQAALLDQAERRINAMAPVRPGPLTKDRLIMALAELKPSMPGRRDLWLNESADFILKSLRPTPSPDEEGK